VGEVRTIGLVGHTGTGKTALTNAILKIGGGKTLLDNSPEAKSRGSSVDLNIATLKKGDQILNVLDAPGYGEFVEETFKSVWTADTSVLVVHGEKGIEVQTEIAWNIIQKYDRPALILVNMMDHANANFGKVVSEMQEKFGTHVTPIEWPIVEGGKFVGIVDVIDLTSRYFDGKTGPVPTNLQSEVKAAREILIEGLSEVDEEMLGHFIENQEITPTEIKKDMKEGLHRRTVFPVLASSALVDKSIEFLTQLILTLTPAFGDTHQSTNDFVGMIFNAASDQYLGALAFTKIMSGSLKEGADFTNINHKRAEKAKEILRASGEKPEKITEAGPGEIVLLTKLHAFTLGDTLSSKPNQEPLSLGALPTTVFPRAIEPLSDADEEKMSTALRELTSTKATLRVYRDDVTHEMILSGIGDTQLAVMVDRLKNRYGTHVRLLKPRVPYKETVTAMAKADYKHKKQSGGRGQYGEVHLRVEPLPRGQGFEFADEVKGGVIPNSFIPAVEKGIVEALPMGKHGYPQTDLKAAVFYGSYHDVDSSEIAFKIAASQAFKMAIENAKPVLLEPVMKVTIHTPVEFTGVLMSSLSGKRSRIHGMEQEEHHWERIEAEAPLAEVQDFALELKSITQGRATFRMEFLHYQPVMSDKLTEDLLKRERKDGAR
jgi:elongation factor G